MRFLFVRESQSLTRIAASQTYGHLEHPYSETLPPGDRNPRLPEQVESRDTLKRY